MNNFLEEKEQLSCWLSKLPMSKDIDQQIEKTHARLENMSRLVQWTAAAPLATRAFWKAGIFMCSSFFIKEKAEPRRKAAIQSYVDFKKKIRDTDAINSYSNPIKNEFVIGLKGLQDKDNKMFSQLKNSWTETDLFSFVYCHELGHVLQARVPQGAGEMSLDQLAKPLPSVLGRGLDEKKLGQFFLALDGLIEAGASSRDEQQSSFFKETGYSIKSLFLENFADVFSVLLLGQRAQDLDKFRLPLSACRKMDALPQEGENLDYVIDHCTTDALDALPVVLKDTNKDYRNLSVDECMDVAKYCTLIGVCKALSRLMKEPALEEFVARPESLSLIFGDTAKEKSLGSLLTQVWDACIPQGLHCDKSFKEWLGMSPISSKLSIR